jgi:CRISPR-associated endonuclease/helicase Cas3
MTLRCGLLLANRAHAATISHNLVKAMADELATFRSAFEELHGKGNLPFPWQENLFHEFCRGYLPSALDLPTGLGKTSVIAIWLLARAFAQEPNRNRIPRRLVYVVDRRAVVDQATAEAEKLRTWLEGNTEDLKARLGLGEASLPISTLRGQHLDNREWLADPTTPAIVVGTVDMIGSRLLFSGYGVSAKMRPYHAGLLGADTLVVLDEVHLVPPFEALLRAIAHDSKKQLGPCLSDGAVVPRFRLMSLSATGRENKEAGGETFRLSAEDYEHRVVAKRLKAPKQLTIEDGLPDKKQLAERLAERAWILGAEPRPARLLVYCNSRTAALAVKEEIDKQLTKHGHGERNSSELLVGERRVREREVLFEWLEAQGFIGEATGEPQAPTFLVATAAGEVGVDLDADHMVCDLVEWERMVQRLGRVNRRGHKHARVEVIAAPPKDTKKDAEEWSTRLARLRAPLDVLNGNASPAAIVTLKANEALKDVLQKAQTPAPLRPALTRALVDAWSMTSLEDHTGRPDIQPWLRGWVEDEAQAAIIWRRYLPAANGNAKLVKRQINEFFEAAAPQTSEVLEAETWRVSDWLIARAERASKALAEVDGSGPLRRAKPALLVLNQKNELEEKPLTLDQLTHLADKENKKKQDAFKESLAGRTLVVSSLLGGLTDDGMLDEKFDGEPSTIDTDKAWEPAPPFRVRETSELIPTTNEDWRESHRFAIERSEDGDETRWIVIDQRRNQPESEEGRAIARFDQKLEDHQIAAERIARGFAEALDLSPHYSDYARDCRAVAR